jgi:hypothetical protein
MFLESVQKISNVKSSQNVSIFSLYIYLFVAN